MNGKVCKKFKIPKRELDKLEVEAALELAKNQPEVQRFIKNSKVLETKLLSKAGYDSTVYIVTEKIKKAVTT